MAYVTRFSSGHISSSVSSSTSLIASSKSSGSSTSRPSGREPAGTDHVIIGAGDGQCLVLAAGARNLSTGPEWGAYPVDEAALRHGAGVERETSDPAEAYARFPARESAAYRDGWLPR